MASYTITPMSGSVEPFPGDVITFAVFGQADQNQIGNNSGIGALNLSIDIAGGTLDDGSIAPSSQAFGPVNIGTDAGGFDISMQSNSFAGDNFDAGVALFTFDVAAGLGPTLSVSVDQGTISGVNAAVGIPGPFGQSTDYDVVNFDTVSFNVVPTPGAAAVLGLGALAATRRRR